MRPRGETDILGGGDDASGALVATSQTAGGGGSGSSGAVVGGGGGVHASAGSDGMGMGLGTQLRVDLDGLDVTPRSLLNKFPPLSSGVGGGVSTTGGGESSANAQASESGNKSGDNRTEDKSAAAGDDGAAAASAAAGEEDAAKLTREELEAPVEVRLSETPTITLLHVAGVCIAQDANDRRAVEERNTAYETMVAGRSNSDCYENRPSQTLNFALKDKEVQAEPATVRDVGCTAASYDIFDSQQQTEETTADDELGLKQSQTQYQNESVLQKNVHETVTVSLASPGCLLSIDDESQAVKDAAAADKGGDTAAAAAAALEPKKQQPTTTSEVLAAQQADRILESKELQQSLTYVDRVIQQNLFHARHLLYRDFPSGDSVPLTNVAPPPVDEDASNGSTPPVDEWAMPSAPERAEDSAGGDADASQGGGEDSAAFTIDKDGGARVDKLWAFHAPLTAGRTVTAMAWNKVNLDMLAASYGEFDFTEQRDGLVLFWSVKNPTFPERIIRTQAGVTSLDFSTKHPNLLAVGLYDGTVAIYDTRKEDEFERPVLESGALGQGKHIDPVWQVKWIDKGAERGESLVSISTDGRVTEWSMKKGLSFTPLMVLKRVSNSAAIVGAERGGEGIISRQASGLCFDFPKGDSSVYFAGTEDGLIHKCSCSYNEQYLENYIGHSGPVYKIRASPFWGDVFLSCSADWTIKLWNTKSEEPVLSLHSQNLSAVVFDIAWSPARSTVFSSVTGDGRIEVWDLEQSSLDPVIRVDANEWAEAAAPPPPPTAGTDAGSRVGTANSSRGGDNYGLYDGAAAAAAAAPEAAEDYTLRPLKLTTVMFSDNAPVLVTGDNHGGVTVYRMQGVGVGPPPATDAEQVARLKAAMFPDEVGQAV